MGNIGTTIKSGTRKSLTYVNARLSRTPPANRNQHIYLRILARATDKTPYFSLDGHFITVKIVELDAENQLRAKVVFFIGDTIAAFWAEFDVEVPPSYINHLVEVRIHEMIDGRDFNCEFVYTPQVPDRVGPNRYSREAIYMSSDQAATLRSEIQMSDRDTIIRNQSKEEFYAMEMNQATEPRPASSPSAFALHSDLDSSYEDVILELQKIIDD